MEIRSGKERGSKKEGQHPLPTGKASTPLSEFLLSLHLRYHEQPLRESLVPLSSSSGGKEEPGHRPGAKITTHTPSLLSDPFFRQKSRGAIKGQLTLEQGLEARAARTLLFIEIRMAHPSIRKTVIARRWGSLLYQFQNLTLDLDSCPGPRRRETSPIPCPKASKSVVDLGFLCLFSCLGLPGLFLSLPDPRLPLLPQLG